MNTRRALGAIALIAIAGGWIMSHTARAEEPAKPAPKKIKVSSPKLKEGEAIDKDFTADGRDVSPPIMWSNLPDGTKELALVCDDPDAPMPRPWVHWIVYNIDAAATSLPSELPRDEKLAGPGKLAGALQGPTDFKKPGYRGPAPPPGKVHHYHFKLYALDARLGLEPGLDKAKLLKALEGHILGEGELVGTYKR